MKIKNLKRYPLFYHCIYGRLLKQFWKVFSMHLSNLPSTVLSASFIFSLAHAAHFVWLWRMRQTGDWRQHAARRSTPESNTWARMDIRGNIKNLQRNQHIFYGTCQTILLTQRTATELRLMLMQRRDLFCDKPENHLQSMTPKCLCTRGTHVGMNWRTISPN